MFAFLALEYDFQIFKRTSIIPPHCRQTSLHNADTKPVTKQVNLCILQLSGIFNTGFSCCKPTLVYW